MNCSEWVFWLLSFLLCCVPAGVFIWAITCNPKTLRYNKKKK